MGERNLRGNNGEDLEGQGRRRRGVLWQKQPQLRLVNIGLNKCGAAWLKSWNSVVETSDLKMLQSYYTNSAPIFKNFFLFMFTCNEEKQVVEGPHHPFFPLLPSQPRDCSTAPASSCWAARSPLRDQYSLSGGNLSPNLCRLSLPSRSTSIYLTLRLESLLLLITLMSWLSSGPESFCSIHFLTIWYSQSRWDCISVSHSVNYEALRDKNTINRNQKLI